jgi:hypothetical protein
MSVVQIDFVTPSGAPCSLHVTKDDATDDIIATLERAEKIAAHFAARGWGFASQQPALPSAAEIDKGPTFCGYPCSPTIDDMGLPTWILVNGQQAMRHSKQGDSWWSVKVGDGQYEQVLRIPKGEKVPPVKGL